MSGSVGYGLISRIVQDKDFASIEKAKITEDFIPEPEVREIFRFLRDTFHAPDTTGMVPSAEMVQQRFPNFRLYFSPDPVPIICAHLRVEKIRADLQELGQGLLMSAQSDPLAALARLQTDALKIAQLSEAHDDELSMASAFQVLKNEYETMVESGGVTGIPYPWAILNEELQGMQAEQFIVLYGRPKSMKSWVAIFMAVHAYISSRKRVLFYTREMSVKMVAQRVAATINRVDYRAFKNGRLQPEIRRKVFTTLEELIEDERAASKYTGHQPYFLVTSDRRSRGGGGGIGWLRSKIDQMKPDIVFVDGMYLMKDDRTGKREIDWKAITHISQDLKGTAQDFGIPLIGVTQASRKAQDTKGEDLTELAFADSLGMDADAVFRVTKTKNKDTKLNELVIACPGIREGELDGFVIHGQPATNFGFIRAFTHAEEEKAYAAEVDKKKQAARSSSRPGGAHFSQSSNFQPPFQPQFAKGDAPRTE